MRKMKQDFDFIKSITTEFFEKDEIVRRLNHFSEYKIGDWEKWLQIEFSFFLSEHQEVSGWRREQRFETDKRKSKNQSYIIVDFFVRQKYKQSSIPLEIKQNIYATNCIKKMVKDINKYNKMRRSSSITERELWCMGIHQTVKIETIQDLLREYEFNENFVYIHEIPNTNFTLTLL